MSNFSTLHHQILLMLCSVFIIVCIISSLYVPWVHSIVRIQKSQFELNYPLDVGLLRCFSDVCEDYDDAFRLIRDIHRHYKQTEEDEAPQLPPFPSHSPSSLISHDNYLISTDYPASAPTLLLIETASEFDMTENMTATGISLPPIHLPEKPPKLPPLPPLPSPVLAPTIEHLADHADTHEDMSKIAANQLIDRATLRRIVRPFEMASRMTVVFLFLATILSLVVIVLVLYDAMFLPIYTWYYPADNEKGQYRQFAVHNQPRYYQHVPTAEMPATDASSHHINPKRSLQKLVNIELSLQSKDTPLDKPRVTTHSTTVFTAPPVHHYRPKGRYSPTRLCTPPELSFVDDEEKLQPSASFLSPSSNKRTVKDLVQFYESPMRTPVQKAQEETPHSLNRAYYQAKPVSHHQPEVHDKKNSIVSSLSSYGTERRAEEDAVAMEEDVIVSDSENNSLMNASFSTGDEEDDDDEENALHLTVKDANSEAKLKTDAAHWRHMGYYRALNITLVMALVSLFFALVAYLSFTAVSMTLRGSYYREGVWIVTYMIMVGLFAALRMAIVMLDDQQVYCEKTHCSGDLVQGTMRSRKKSDRQVRNRNRHL